MPITITMPALSPTMEAGTLAKWLVKVGDTVKSGDVIAEIETDKATMEVESIDEGVVAELLVAAGAEDVKVGTVIATLTGEDEEAITPPVIPAQAGTHESRPATPDAPVAQGGGEVAAAPDAPQAPSPPVAATDGGPRVVASPLARRIAQIKGVDLASLTGTGPNGRIVKADVEAAGQAPPQVAAPAAQPTAVILAKAGAQTPAAPAQPTAPTPTPLAPTDVPHEVVKLSNMRRTIARRLTESKTTVPHFYLTVDVRLDALLKLRAELNAGLEKSGVKLSVNDLILKALGVALHQVPDANVSFGGDTLRRFARADISVAVAIPGGLITPVIRDAGNKRLSVIATEMKDLAARARDGKLQPPEYSGGTASLSNLGMYGIKQFDAVINPPEGLILAVGAGEPRPYVVDGALAIATVMSATGSFDHRAIDGSTGAQLMAAFKALVESPLAMLA